MSDVLVRWKIRSAVMTPYGATKRVAGDQDTMDRRKALDLERCGFLEVLGAPEQLVAKAASVLEEDDEA
ncbi:hypothetical protein LCGC14_2157520 [marine sediment metagenome]|uniref:Uncharacterized protein n=1 Tax=marine sediment metagenome TaxID=412755 RepID=A0A0F9G6M4_9ZZZZ